MKTSFFTAVILGFAAFQLQTEAVNLEGHDFDFADYELAEIDGEGKGESAADVDADAHIRRRPVIAFCVAFVIVVYTFLLASPLMGHLDKEDLVSGENRTKRLEDLTDIAHSICL